MGATAEKHNIKIEHDAFEILIEAKERVGAAATAIKVYSEVVRRGAADIIREMDADPDAWHREPGAVRVGAGISGVGYAPNVHEGAGMLGTVDNHERADRMPEWVHREMNGDPGWLRKYCCSHPGAREEFLEWYAAIHTPEEAEIFDKYMIGGADGTG